MVQKGSTDKFIDSKPKITTSSIWDFGRLLYPCWFAIQAANEICDFIVMLKCTSCKYSNSKGDSKRFNLSLFFYFFLHHFDNWYISHLLNLWCFRDTLFAVEGWPWDFAAVAGWFNLSDLILYRACLSPHNAMQRVTVSRVDRENNFQKNRFKVSATVLVQQDK